MAVPGERKPIDSSAVLTTVVLCALWGLQQTAIKAAAGEISPMLQVALRSGIAALLVLLAVRFVIKDPWNPAVRFADCLKVGIGFTLEFFFVSEGLRFTSAAHMSVLLYTAPLFAAVGLSLKLPEERLSPLQWLGVLIAFTGIAVAFLVPALTGDQPRSSGDLWWLGDLLGLGSGISWGLTTYFMRTTTMNTVAPSQMLFWQLLAAFVFLITTALCTGQTTFSPALTGWSSFIFQTFFVSFASYLVWCRLLRTYLAARLGVLVFATPLFGVLFGVLILGEEVGWPFVTGSVCVLAGIILVQGSLKFFRRRH